MGLFRAESGFYDKVIAAWLKAKKISHIISAHLIQALQQSLVDQCKWQRVEVGPEVFECGPVGLALGARTPAEIAVSVVAEIVQVKNRVAAAALCT